MTVNELITALDLLPADADVLLEGAFMGQRPLDAVDLSEDGDSVVFRAADSAPTEKIEKV